MADTGEAMEVDTGEERGYGEENGGVGAAVAGGVAAGTVAANGEGGMGISIGDGLKGGPAGCDEIPDGDVAVLNNHHSEVSLSVAPRRSVGNLGCVCRITTKRAKMQLAGLRIVPS